MVVQTQVQLQLQMVLMQSTATPNGTGEVVVGGNTNPGTLVLKL